jgi:hypothetical protein
MFSIVAAVTTYTTNYTTTNAGLNGGLVAGILGGSLIAYLVYGYFVGRVLQKAGKDLWIGFVPVYSTWTLFEIAGKPGWWSLIALTGAIPLLGLLGDLAFFVLYIIAMLELAKRFNRSTVFAVFGLIIFGLVGYIILGLGKDEYHGVPASDSTFPPTPNPTGPTTI